MRIAYQYRLKPTTEQKAVINKWLDMLRYQYNYLLADRFDWYQHNRCPINSCPLITSIPELREQPDYYNQKRSLTKLKEERPWYQAIHSQVLQNMVERVKTTFERYLKCDSNGKRSGKPRFKSKNQYKSFTYPQGKEIRFKNKRIYLPKIGDIKIVWHRKLPTGFDIKTVTITKKADGFYITFSLEDKSVPDIKNEIKPTLKNSIGIDLGLEKFLTTSNGILIPPPKYLRKAETRLAKLQKKASSRPKKSRARKLLYKKVAKLHQKIARQRKDFHYKTATKLLATADCVFVEDLQVANMTRRCKPKQDDSGNYLPNNQATKSGLNKSFADAGLSQFVEILTSKAEKAGLLVVKVDPRGTSQHCSECLNRVPKELKDRWHLCPNCGLMLDRDLNSAILIQKVGLDTALLKNAQSSKLKKEKPTL